MSLFLLIIKKFNENEPLPAKQVEEIEQYFSYRWANDKNFAIHTKAEFDLLDQLPEQVQYDIYLDFFFKQSIQIYMASLAFDMPALCCEQKRMLLKMKIKVSEAN